MPKREGAKGRGHLSHDAQTSIAPLPLPPRITDRMERQTGSVTLHFVQGELRRLEFRTFEGPEEQRVG